MGRTTRTLLMLGLLAVPAAPLWAGGFALFGAYWEPDKAEEVYGGGARLAFGLGPVLGFELRGTYLEDLTLRESGAGGRLEAIPVELGLTVNFARRTSFNPYVGGGATYVLLERDGGSVDDEVGWYAVGGFELGNPRGFGFLVEGIWRQVEATVEVRREAGTVILREAVDLNLDGFGIHAGFLWRW